MDNWQKQRNTECENFLCFQRQSIKCYNKKTFLCLLSVLYSNNWLFAIAVIHTHTKKTPTKSRVGKLQHNYCAFFITLYVIVLLTLQPLLK